MKPIIVTEQQKRSVTCPRCGRAPGKACRNQQSVWPKHNERAHTERRKAYLATVQP